MQPFRLVFVTSLVPHAVASTGYEVANAAVIDGLRRAGAHVTVLGFTWPGHKAAESADTIVLGEVEVRTEGAGIKRKIGWVLKSFLTGLTVSSTTAAANSPGLSAIVQFAGILPIPRTECAVATLGMPSSNVSMDLS